MDTAKMYSDLMNEADNLEWNVAQSTCNKPWVLLVMRKLAELVSFFGLLKNSVKDMQTRVDGQARYSQAIDNRLGMIEERLANEAAHAKTAVEELERVEALGAKVEAINERVSGIESQMEEFDPNGEDLDGAEPVFNVPGSACAFEALKRCAERTGFRILKAESIHGIHIQCQCPKDSEAVTEPKIAPKADNVVPLRPDLGTYDLRLCVPVGPDSLSILEAQAESEGFSSVEDWIGTRLRRSLAMFVTAVRNNRRAQE